MDITFNEIFLLVIAFIQFIFWFNYELLAAFYHLIFPPQLKDIQGETVLITGAGNGIGRELAREYKNHGCKVICLDIDEKNNKQIVKELNAGSPNTAFAYTCDVTKREDVQKIAQKIKTDVGTVTVLINNAGIMPTRSISEHTHEVIRRVIDVNLMSHYWTLEAFLPSMYEKKHGHIIAISSLLGLQGFPNVVPYCTSKFGVRGLMESLVSEIMDLHSDCDIRCLTVCPSWVNTNLVRTAKVKFPNLIKTLSPKTVAREIVLAHKRNDREITIPWFYVKFIHALRLLPYKCIQIVRNFLDGKVECDLHLQ
jgi:all-trans-retinol dehydrogenase (NAD+)